jgi:hypothetical protein
MRVCIDDIHGRAAVAEGLAATKSHAAFVWSVADLLRGDYRRSEYGRVILPLTASADVGAACGRLGSHRF